MRTVIQSLGMYPRLSGFVMNILQRLIVKQVWKFPKVWEGFVKCCEVCVAFKFLSYSGKCLFNAKLFSIFPVILNKSKLWYPFGKNFIIYNYACIFKIIIPVFLCFTCSLFVRFYFPCRNEFFTFQINNLQNYCLKQSP